MHLKRALAASLAAAAVATTGATAMTPAANANVQVGASGWQWGNPLPQGNTLRAASFAGATGYAAGDFGTLLKTTDGGATWSGLPVGTFQGLSIVQAVDANTVFAGGGCVARRSTDGGKTFTAVSFTPVESSCRAQLRALSFVSPTLGFLLLDDGSVFTTDDGGTQFAQRTALPGTGAAGGVAAPSSLAFTSPTTGVATAGGRIFQTTDAGVSWRVVAEPGGQVSQLWFLDATYGFAVGTGGLFLRTDDGGRTWTPGDLGAGALPYSAIRCVDPQLCLLSTSNGAQLVRTTNASARADPPPAPPVAKISSAVITPSTDAIFTAAFASATRVSALGANGATVLSDDAGTTFSPVGGRLSGVYSSIRTAASAGRAYATGNVGALARTTDGGRSWTRTSVPTAADLVDVSFPTTDVGYALDDGGGLFRSANGGSTWKTLGTGSTAKARAVLAPSANLVLAIGPRGVRRSTDGGETFARIASRAVASKQLTGVAAARGGAIFVWGADAIARSRDAGSTWTTLRKPGATNRARKRLRVQQVAFSSATTGLLRDGDGRIWRTANAGRSWTVLPAVGTGLTTGMAVAGHRSAYLVVGSFGGQQGGYLLHTTDAGATWQPQFVVSDQIRPAGIAATAAGTDYLLAGNASLLSSTSGGSEGERSTLTLSPPRRTPSKPGRITVSGRLRPAGGSARVTVSSLAAASTSWRSQTVDVAANGAFVTGWQVPRGTTRFVAQWTGDFDSAGAGSRVLEVTVRPAPRRARRHAARRPRRGR
jgi:photosystem II stability/assembly factor-like uncharacterized protein